MDIYAYTSYSVSSFQLLESGVEEGGKKNSGGRRNKSVKILDIK